MNRDDSSVPLAGLTVCVLLLIRSGGFSEIFSGGFEVLLGWAMIIGYLVGYLVWHLTLPVFGLSFAVHLWDSVHVRPSKKFANPWVISLLSIVGFLGVYCTALIYGAISGVFLAVIGATEFGGSGWTMLVSLAPLHVMSCILLFQTSKQACKSVENRLAKFLHCLALYALLQLEWNLYDRLLPTDSLQLPAWWYWTCTMLDQLSIFCGWLVLQFPRIGTNDLRHQTDTLRDFEPTL